MGFHAHYRDFLTSSCLTTCPKLTTPQPLKITGPATGYARSSSTFRRRTTTVQNQGPAGQAFTILLPPPNVTGRLHMGHMLNQTEMDILTRWRRMSGRLALWVPGTDHAGIATQMMVERQLAEEGTSRQKLGREAFVDRVWKWREHYGGAILEQMKRLGVSVDWSREFFTMDERLSVAVREAFVRLYHQGLIYRGAYIVNWCPRCQTAISDLEVVHQEQKGHLWEIRYPVLGDGGKETGEFVTVATTRPETMLGDTAVAIHPEDERYLHLHGKKLSLPLMHREIPIVVDPWVSREFGTGAVKVTPAHDPNDFALARAAPFAFDQRDGRSRAHQRGGRRLRWARPLRRAQEDRCRPRSAGAVGRGQGLHQQRGPLRPLQDGGRAAAFDAVVRGGEQEAGGRRRIAGREGHRRREGGRRRQKADPLHAGELREDLPRVDGRTSTTGASRGSCGGVIAFRRGIARACHKITVPEPGGGDPAACAHCGSKEITQETDVLDTWFSSGLLPVSVFGWPNVTAETRAISTRSIRRACSSPASTFSSSGWRA